MAWIESFWQAAIVMVIGMSVVFLFLAALILLMRIAGRIVARLAPPPEPVRAGAPAGMPARGDEGAVAAAIAAVMKYAADKQNRST